MSALQTSERERPLRWSAWLDAVCRPVVFAPLLLALGGGISIAIADRGLPSPDEGAVLTGAAKILRGAVYYRDIDAYPFPGAPYLVALGMGLFGEHLSVARALAAVLYCAALLSLYAVAVPLLGRRRAALFGLSLLGFKFLAWPAFTAYMYADVSFSFACGAIALLMRHSFGGPSARLVLAGVCAGAALLSKQNLGIYLVAAGSTLLLVPEWLGLRVSARRARWAEVTVFAAGVAAPLAPVLAYFALHGVLRDMLASGLLRPFTGYLPTSGVAFSDLLRWWELGSIRNLTAFPYLATQYWAMLMQGQLPGASWYPTYWLAGEVFTRLLYTSVPLAFLGVCALWIRARRSGLPSEREGRLGAFAILALAVVLSAFPRADYYHVISVYPVVWLLLFALRDPRRERRALARIEAIAVCLLLLVSAVLSLRYYAHLDYHLKIERADLHVASKNAWIEPLVDFVSREVADDEPFFVYGHEAYYYFFTGRFYPWPFPQLYPGQAGGDGGRALVELLEQRPPKLVVRGVHLWPGIPPVASYAPILDAYVSSRFEPDGEVFRHHPAAGGVEPEGWVLVVLRPRGGPPPRLGSGS